MTDQPQPRKHLAKRWWGKNGLIIRCTCGQWESRRGDTRRQQDDAHRAHRIDMGETVRPRKLTRVEQLEAEVRRLTAERDRYRDAWRNARTRARDSAADEAMWRRIVTSTEQDRDRVIADNDRLAAELQQARQQTADRIAVELATIDPPEWALAGQYGGQDAIRIARAVGTGCDCENADQPGHYIDHLTTAPRVTECRGPHPVAEHSCCQLPAGHDGWHAADVGSWPSSNWPPTATAAVSGA